MGFRIKTSLRPRLNLLDIPKPINPKDRLSRRQLDLLLPKPTSLQDRRSHRQLDLLPDRNLRRPNQQLRRPRLVIPEHTEGEDLPPSLKPPRRLGKLLQ